MEQLVPKQERVPRYSGVGVYSGQVMTVTGPIPVEDLGVTLMHEHIFLDASSWWQKPKSAERRNIALQPVNISILGELRMDPFVNLDNTQLNDFETAVAELMQYRELGGNTVVDVTNNDIGRDPVALQRVSRRTGLHIIAGTGHYLEVAHPPYLSTLSVDEICQEILDEILVGIRGEYDVPLGNIRPGIIGEIGVSAKFTPAERKSLQAAARAAAQTELPLTIHMPGWERLGHEVLDVVASEGQDLAFTILGHMNPSLNDFDYQVSLMQRGAFLEYDMVGMDFFYADQQAQSPCDEENARAIKRLIDAGYIHQILLSQDVFLKMMLTRYGGFGYAYILRHFVPRLRRLGITEAQINILLVENPRRVFSAKYRFSS